MQPEGAYEAFSHARRLVGEHREGYLDGLEVGLRGEVQDLLDHHAADDGKDWSPDWSNSAARVWEGAGSPPEIEGYSIGRQIGAGGMGTVFEAEQHQPRRRVAIKVLHLASGEARRRFEREARVLASLAHSGIARIYAQGVVGSQPYLVMELVDGVALLEAARGLDEGARIELLARVCEAVGHAHEHGVIHRDLKPANVLVTTAGEPKVLDFGLARVMGGDTMQTATGHILGTVAYMSPEQALGVPGAVDTRSDVYSLGVMAYEMLSGRPPLDLGGKPLPAVARALLEEDPKPLPGSGDLPVVVGMALAKEKERRYSTASALADDLRRVLAHEPVVARPGSATYQVRRFIRRNRAVVGGMAATIVALAIGLVIAIHFAAEARQETRRARHKAALASMQAAGAAAAIGAERNLSRHLMQVPIEERGWEWRYLAELLDATERKAYLRSNPNLAVIGATGRHALMVTHSGERELVSLDPWGTRLVWKGRAPPDWWHAHAFAGDTALGLVKGPDGLVLTGPNGRNIPIPGTQGARLVSAMAGSVDGRWLAWSEAMANDGHHLRLWSVTERRTVWRARLPFDKAREIAFREDGGALVAGTIVGRVLVYEIGSAEPVLSIRPHTESVTAVALSPDGNEVASSAVSLPIELRDVRTGKLRARLAGHLARVRSLAYRADGRVLASGAQDRTIRIWNCDTLACDRILMGRSGTVLGLRFGSDGRTLLSAGVGGVREWDIGRPSVLRLHRGLAQGNASPYVYGVAFSPDGNRIASCGWDGTARVADAATGRLLKTLGRGGLYGAIAFSPDGNTLALSRRNIELWDIASGELRASWPGKADCQGLAYSPDSARLAVASQGAVRIHEVKTGAIIVEWEQRAAAFVRIAWSRDGTLLAHTGDRRALVIRRVSDGEVLHRKPDKGVCAVAFSPDGRLVAAGSMTGLVKLWDTRSGELVHTLNGHAGTVYAVEFSPDGTRLATGGEDATVRIWDASDGEQRLVLRGHDHYVMDLSFSPDGTTLASASGDNTVRLWRAGKASGE